MVNLNGNSYNFDLYDNVNTVNQSYFIYDLLKFKSKEYFKILQQKKFFLFYYYYNNENQFMFAIKPIITNLLSLKLLWKKNFLTFVIQNYNNDFVDNYHIISLNNLKFNDYVSNIKKIDLTFNTNNENVLKQSPLIFKISKLLNELYIFLHLKHNKSYIRFLEISKLYSLYSVFHQTHQFDFYNINFLQEKFLNKDYYFNIYNNLISTLNTKNVSLIFSYLNFIKSNYNYPFFFLFKI